jgi:hypothetical protein
MPENSTPAPASQPEKSGAQPKPAPTEKPQEYSHLPMSEEFDRAKWTLPPIVPVLIAAGVVAVIIAVVSFTNRPKPVVAGTITKIASADQDGNTMAAVQVKLDNVIEKQIWIKSIDSELETSDGKKYTDHAAAASDANLYFKAFPQLTEARAEPLREELKIPTKTSFTGVTVFSYPVDTKAFNERKSLTLRIQLYDQPTVVVKQP